MQNPVNPQFFPNGVPSDVAGASGRALGGIEYGTLQPVQTICGLRKKVFFIVLAAAIVAIVVGLGAGLGVALSKNNNNAPAGTVTVTAGAGAGADPPDRTTFSQPDSTTSTGSVESTTSAGSVESTSASPGDTETVSTSESKSTPTGTTTTSITPLTSPEPSEAARFLIRMGFWTITFSKYSSSGDLCTYFNSLHPVTTVIEPYINGREYSYAARWSQTSSEVVLTEPSTTVTIYDTAYSATATFATQAATNVPAWDFRTSIVPTVYDCEFTGLLQLLFEETGRMRYIYTVNLRDTCPIGENSATGGSSCSIYWRLVRSD